MINEIINESPSIYTCVCECVYLEEKYTNNVHTYILYLNFLTIQLFIQVSFFSHNSPQKSCILFHITYRSKEPKGITLENSLTPKGKESAYNAGGSSWIAMSGRSPGGGYDRESLQRKSLVGYSLWGHRVRHD